MRTINRAPRPGAGGRDRAYWLAAAAFVVGDAALAALALVLL